MLIALYEPFKASFAANSLSPSSYAGTQAGPPTRLFSLF
jgi:hypothetical protein